MIFDTKLLEFKVSTSKDIELKTLCQAIYFGWPILRKFWTYREDLTCTYCLVVKGNFIVIPKGMRQEIFSCIHGAYQARGKVFWPGITFEIVSFVISCDVCNKYRKSKPKHPLLPYPVPDGPWQKVGKANQ
ncbi:hypothetical protein PR048_014070 [Dryococelus australis]|uniref:Integrase zinc-binding domain-containing protein n=1 Tax=Dryococelus australis TaxID=614101 RepID=A0ABQ9HTY0_9NEOP|nr:hypothetical protein PR048_014070 [Dryococelus australis]